MKNPPVLYNPCDIEQCLELTEDQWRFLADHTEAIKADWPSWDQPVTKPWHDQTFMGVPIKNNCFCCEFVKVIAPEGEVAVQPGKCCPHCPLYAIWPYGCESDDYPDTPWNRWLMTESPYHDADKYKEDEELRLADRRAAAKFIADAAAARLATLRATKEVK